MSDREFDELLKRLARTGEDPAPEGFDARLDEMMEGLPMKKKSFGTVRGACIAVAICAALAVSAVAASPSLRDALTSTLGSFAPYTQSIEGEAVDQDIRVRVVSAMADSVKATVYAELTDLSGQGRLANVAECGYLELDYPDDEKTEGLCAGTFGKRLIAYDEETQTLLCAYDAQYGEVQAMSTTGTLEIGRITMAKKLVDVDSLDEKLLTGRFLETRTLEGGETVLLPGQTKNDWTNEEKVTLSSMGYAEDGRLHFLFAFPEGVNAAKSYVSFVVSSKTDLKRNGSYNRDMRDVHFTQDGKDYLDYSVTGIPADREDIEFVNTYLVLADFTPDIEGEWKIPVSLERVKETASPLSGNVSGVGLKQLRMSPLGVIIETEPTEGLGIAYDPVQAYFADGSKVELEQEPTVISPRYPVQYRWEFPQAVDDVNDIVGLSVGRWYIPVENGEAGAGYWLKPGART